MEPNAEGNLQKIPRKPNGGARAKINDPKGWADFDAALAASPRYDGIEFMLSADDSYTFIDLDHCISPDGIIERWAQKIVNDFDSYTEYSRSGSGIHILIRGAKPEPHCRNTRDYPNIEIYDHSRPIVMTGLLVPNTSGIIQPAPNELAEFYYRIFPKPSSEEVAEQDRLFQESGNTATLSLTDSELITKACSNPKNGASIDLLWNGNKSEYGDNDSDADCALCSHLCWWTNGDRDRMERLFRQSGLMRDKWERPDYRERTFNKAFQGFRGGYTGRHGHGAKKTALKSTRIKSAIEDAVIGAIANGYGTPDNILVALEESFPDISIIAVSAALTTCEMAGEIQKTVAGYKLAGATAPRVDPETGEILDPPELKYLTDLGNAEYMIDLYGRDLRYDVDSGRWLHWCGTHWNRDNTGQIERIARSTIRGLYDVLRTTTDPDRAKALFAHIRKSESHPRMQAQISDARFCAGVPIKAFELDADNWRLNCQNGTLNLRNGELETHRQADLISKIVPIDYDPNATAPRWQQFLREVFLDDAELIQFVQTAIGYCLTGDTSEESVFILYGRGQCGKSKFVEAIRIIFGDYIRSAAIETFTEKNDTNTADLASLVGARMVTASEAGDSKSFNEPLLKRVSGRDEIKCRFLYKEFFEYTPTFKLLFATNEVPRIRSQGPEMRRRLKIIPFKQRFYAPGEGEPVRDQHLDRALRAEAPGILTWAVEGCLRWQAQDGLILPRIVKSEIQGLFEDQDPLGEFLESEWDFSAQLSTPPAEIWASYHQWCKDHNHPLIFQQTSSLSRNLVKRDGIAVAKNVFGKRILRGIGHLTDDLTENTDKDLFLESSPCKNLHEEELREIDSICLDPSKDENATENLEDDNVF
jgi:putative DNA primase/helicase